MPSSTARSSGFTSTSGSCSMRCGIIVLYNRLRDNPDLAMPPRTFFFAGKAAPAYRLAKLIIKFINNLALTIDGDGAVRGRMKVVFLPEYCATLAERLIPASDVSNQISTAGYEASGTSNMKFMMNGALTIGTRDGATIEMAQEAGEENFFLFGLTAAEVAGSRGWYSPRWHYEHEPETRAALDLISFRPFQPERTGHLHPACRHPADQRGLLYAPGGPAVVPGGGQAIGRAVRESGCLGRQGDPQRGRFREVFQRPHDRRVRRTYLERGALPSALKRRSLSGAPVSGWRGKREINRPPPPPSPSKERDGLHYVRPCGLPRPPAREYARRHQFTPYYCLLRRLLLCPHQELGCRVGARQQRESHLPAAGSLTLDRQPPQNLSLTEHYNVLGGKRCPP
jgi:hypothetical protein